MKKVLTAVLLAAILALCAFILSTGVAIGQTSAPPNAKVLKYTPRTGGTTASTKDTVMNGQTVTMYIGAKGGRYIYATSRTGNVYKKYLPKG